MDDIRKYTKAWDEGVDKVRGRVEQAKERVEDMADDARARGEEAWKDGLKFIQKHPTESLGAALLAGLVLGVLLTSRRRD